MKTLAWISGILAVITMIFAAIMWLFIDNSFLGVARTVEWVHVTNALLLFTIVFKMCEKKE